ncbi:MAG: biosynthetic-type acetolactate synthase large subunit [Candidatus Omnitrophota bacterium]|jgi:acetolactate synthase-1/2/3 large subunit|nr:MAG: biosynthetic-type acetolactate synthase large subunit [Candidatus Omnitrophota bacterium]
MKNNGAEIITKKLSQHGVKFVFEFPGGSICPILDEIAKSPDIKIICFRHEQAAMLAAQGYSMATGKTSVCMATSGPGASNLVTGIANAYMDSIPVVVITGQVAVWDLKSRRKIRQRGFQELDIVSVARSITKHAYLVKDVNELGKVLDKAFFIAASGRPGPVLVDIPINVQYTQGKSTSVEFKSPRVVSLKNKIKPLVSKLLGSKRPLVVLGGGIMISGVKEQIGKIIMRHKIPVVTTLMGLSAIDSDCMLNLGLTGYAGSRQAEDALRQADFILGLGLRFDNRAFPKASKEFSRNAFIAHVDCDSSELNHRVRVNMAIEADLKVFIKEFDLQLKERPFVAGYDWRNSVVRMKKELLNKRLRAKGPCFLIQELSALLKNRHAIITTDVGQHQLWTAQCFDITDKQKLLFSGGLGAMGFGLPAAIGAQIARRNFQVVNITSDGSFQMNIQELATIREYNLPVKIIVLNNKTLGLVRQIQEFAFSKRYVSTVMNFDADFVSIAKAYGIKAKRIYRAGDAGRYLRELVNSRQSMLLEFVVNGTQNVYPVRIKGKTIYGK